MGYGYGGGVYSPSFIIFLVLILLFFGGGVGGYGYTDK